MALKFQNNSIPPWTWKFNNYKTLVTTHSLSLAFRHPTAHATICHGQDHSTKHTTLLVDSFHEHKRLKSLLHNLNSNQNPLQLLQQDGDWSKDDFWSVIKFLKPSARSNQILQVHSLAHLFFLAARKIEFVFSLSLSVVGFLNRCFICGGTWRKQELMNSIMRRL